MYKVGIIGVTGYAGVELVKGIEEHPQVEIVYLGSEGAKGEPLSHVYPFYHGCELGKKNIASIYPEDDLEEVPDIIFAALPHGVSMDVVAAWIDKGVRVIDLSADYRIKDTDIYNNWYKINHNQRSLLDQAVYGLCELNYDDIPSSKLIANPGCFPTGALLALYPLLKGGLISSDDIVIDSKTGVSGGGKTPKQVFHYPERTENFQAYSVGAHRHSPEIKTQLERANDGNVDLIFTPHLVPMSRGIFTTIYVKFTSEALENFTDKDILNYYEDYYQNAQFVTPTTSTPQTKWVAGSNSAMLTAKLIPGTNRCVLMSAIDNLVKGAAGQAIQNMNLMLGLEENLGLAKRPTWP